MVEVSDIKTSANAFNKAAKGLEKVGIDARPIQVMTGVMQMVSGGATVWTAATAVAQRRTMVNQAKFTAQIAKYGPTAFVFAGAAIATGLLVEMILERVLGDVDRE